MEEPAQTTSSEPNQFSFSCSAELDIAKCTQVDDFTIMVSLRAPYCETTHRAPIDLVTVIDRSGSMEGEKLSLVLDTLSFVIRQLQSKDKLSVVTYDDKVATVLPLMPMNSTGKISAQDKVRTIKSGNTTDLCGGLMEGIKVISSRTEKNEVSSVLLFTDGLANCGIQKTPDIIQEIAKKDPLPCTLYTFGFGADHDATMLKAISDKGNGIYAFINDKDNIANAFADCLGGLLSVVAQNINVELTFANGTTLNKIQTNYKQQETDGTHNIILGDIQSEEEKDILIRVKLPEITSAERAPIIGIKISYFDVLKSKQEERELTFSLPRDDTAVPTPNLAVDRQKNRMIVADALSKAKSLADSGDIQSARKELTDASTLLQNSATASDEYVQTLIKDLIDCRDTLQDRQSYTTRGAQQMATYSSSHYAQRATYSVQSYTTTSRGIMRQRLDDDQ
jgi:uncharacterized protein YegL